MQLNNSGLVDAQSGTLALENSGIEGQLTAGSGAVLIGAFGLLPVVSEQCR
jgi:hypothetical protein